MNIPIGLQLFPFIRNSFVGVGNSVKIRDILYSRNKGTNSKIIIVAVYW